MSQKSLKRIHTFALKQQNNTVGQEREEESKEETSPVKQSKVYYVEEHVKVLTEIIAHADPILSELTSQIHSFQKMVNRKITAKQRDVELFQRYGKDDFMAERDMLNISFENL